MSDSLNGKSLANLRDAVIALENQEVRSPHGDPGPCLTLIRLGNLTHNPSLTTITDSRHIAGCRKCTVRIRAMQRELGKEPRLAFEAAVSELKRELPRFAEAEAVAHEVFHHIHDLCGEPEHSTWDEIHGPVLALRRHHSHGEKDDAESIVVMTFTAVAAALADAATPFARGLDAAWAPVQMIVNLGAEVVQHHHEQVAKRFVEGYVAVVEATPAPIRSALTYGLRALLDRPHTKQVATEIVAYIAGHGDSAVDSIVDALASTEQPHLKPIVHTGTRGSDLLTIDRWIDELDDRLRVQGDISAIVSAVQKNVGALLTPVFDGIDPAAQLRQLLVTRHYLSRAVAHIHDHFPHTIDFVHYLGDLAYVVMHEAQLRDHQYFVAIETLSAIGANQPIMKVMTELLDTPDDDMRRALFLYFLGIADRAHTATPLRFIGEKNDWTFEGGNGHPITTFAAGAVALAKHDSDIAALVDWSRLHLDRKAEKVKKHIARA